MAKSKQAPAAVEEFRQRPLFHLAFRVNDLEATRNFYVDVLGCRVGRSSDTWIDFDFFGYQISAHCLGKGMPSPTNEVDGHDIPIPAPLPHLSASSLPPPGCCAGWSPDPYTRAQKCSFS